MAILMGPPQTENAPGPAASQLHAIVAQVLQSEACAAFNRAYHEDDAEQYRELGRILYQRGMHERIQALFTRGDEQNLALGLLSDGGAS